VANLRFASVPFDSASKPVVIVKLCFYEQINVKLIALGYLTLTNNKLIICYIDVEKSGYGRGVKMVWFGWKGTSRF
jgi:hypothetical protein